MRAAYLFWSLIASTSWAETWQLHPGLGIKAADAYVSSKNPSDHYNATVTAAQGLLQLKREDAETNWDNQLSVEAAKNPRAYGETNLHSRFQLREKVSATSFDLHYRQTHGFDPLVQAIEEAAVKD